MLPRFSAWTSRLMWHPMQPLATNKRSPRAACESGGGVGLPAAITVNSGRVESVNSLWIWIVHFPGRGRTRVAVYSPVVFVLTADTFTICVSDFAVIFGLRLPSGETP